MFAEGKWFRSQMECVEFAENHIPVGQFQWFLDIVSYLQLMTDETASTSESQRDELHSENVQKIKKQYIVIPTFKTYVHHILGGLG